MIRYQCIPGKQQTPSKTIIVDKSSFHNKRAHEQLKLFVERPKTVAKTHRSLFCGKKVVKVRNEKAGGVTRSFSKETGMVPDGAGFDLVVNFSVYDLLAQPYASFFSSHHIHY